MRWQMFLILLLVVPVAFADLRADYAAKGYKIIDVCGVDVAVKVSDSDWDGDGLPNDMEAKYGTNPRMFDTDGDCISDLFDTGAGTYSYNLEPFLKYIEKKYGDLEKAMKGIKGEKFFAVYEPGGATGTPEQVMQLWKNGFGWGICKKIATKMSGTRRDSDGDGRPDNYEYLTSYGTGWSTDHLVEISGKGPADNVFLILEIAKGRDVFGRTLHEEDAEYWRGGREDVRTAVGNILPQTCPVHPDPDGDGVTDAVELAHNCKPDNPDSDGDGIGDAEEIMRGTDCSYWDTDDDGVWDKTEMDYGLNPKNPDTDGDGRKDGYEFNMVPDIWNMDSPLWKQYYYRPYPFLNDFEGNVAKISEEVVDKTAERINAVANKIQSDPAYCAKRKDCDGDGLEDAMDPFPGIYDVDWDGAPDGAEVNAGTDIYHSDSDEDHLLDGVELKVGSDPLNSDTDGDGLGDARELYLGTDPLNPDTDGDGLSDKYEDDEYGISPLKADTDGDGIDDRTEKFTMIMVTRGCKTRFTRAERGDKVVYVYVGPATPWTYTLQYPPYDADSDGDGLSDAEEWGKTSGYAADSDGDGLSDPEEYAKGTDPLNPDSDCDSLMDGSDPNPHDPMDGARKYAEDTLRTDLSGYTVRITDGTKEVVPEPTEKRIETAFDVSNVECSGETVKNRWGTFCLVREKNTVTLTAKIQWTANGQPVSVKDFRVETKRLDIFVNRPKCDVNKDTVRCTVSLEEKPHSPAAYASFYIVLMGDVNGKHVSKVLDFPTVAFVFKPELSIYGEWEHSTGEYEHGKVKIVCKYCKYAIVSTDRGYLSTRRVKKVRLPFKNSWFPEEKHTYVFPELPKIKTVKAEDLIDVDIDAPVVGDAIAVFNEAAKVGTYVRAAMESKRKVNYIMLAGYHGVKTIAKIIMAADGAPENSAAKEVAEKKVRKEVAEKAAEESTEGIPSAIAEKIQDEMKSKAEESIDEIVTNYVLEYQKLEELRASKTGCTYPIHVKACNAFGDCVEKDYSLDGVCFKVGD